MRSSARTLVSRLARFFAACALVFGAACIDGGSTIEERACEADPDCYSGNPCVVDRCEEGRCVSSALSARQPGGGDLDRDGRCDGGDGDDDGDDVADLDDLCPRSPPGSVDDHDGDGCLDGEDDDDDNDGIPDAEDACPLGVSDLDNDVDGDGCANGIDTLDADGDGRLDGDDRCPFEDAPWTSTPETDRDGDGCNDETTDDDDDGDGRPDALDDCPRGVTGWFSIAETDHDRDGCRDLDEDLDDDNDGVRDVLDDCDQSPIGADVGWRGDLPGEGDAGLPDEADHDFDNDGCDDRFEDRDDDNDGVPDALDDCLTTVLERVLFGDRDEDGCYDREDDDDDGDGVLDVDDGCPAGDTGWQSLPPVDRDGDGCRDLSEDRDDDGDGLEDQVDACPLDAAVNDPDGDGCDDAIDPDDDNDGVPDALDDCPTDYSPVPRPDHDGDGCDDAVDPDDDNDGVPDEIDACLGAVPGRLADGGLDLDGDGCIDGREDLDDDGDGVPDAEDRCPVGEQGWSSDEPGNDNDGDGCLDATEDPDDDDDGVPDDADCQPLDPAVAPGFEELCDGVDNDCDGAIDEGAQQLYFRDRDGDGFGDPATPVHDCPGARAVSLDGTDCDDTDPDRNPRDGCALPLGLRDGRWSGPIRLVVYRANGGGGGPGVPDGPDGPPDDGPGIEDPSEIDVCEGTLNLTIRAAAAEQVLGRYSCVFGGELAAVQVPDGGLRGALDADESAAAGDASGPVIGGFVLVFDGPSTAWGALSGEVSRQVEAGARAEVSYTLERQDTP